MPMGKFVHLKQKSQKLIDLCPFHMAMQNQGYLKTQIFVEANYFRKKSSLGHYLIDLQVCFGKDSSKQFRSANKSC